MQHQNPSQSKPNQKAQLDEELKTCEKQLKKSEESLKKLKAPLLDAASPLLEVIDTVSPTGFLENLTIYQDLFLNLQQHIQTGIFILPSSHEISHSININTSELKTETEVKQCYVEFNSNMICFNGKKNNNEDMRWDIKHKAEKASTLTDEMTYIFLGNQKLTMQLKNTNTMEIIVTLESQQEISPTDVVQNYEIPLKLDNYKVNIILKNQIQKDSILRFIEVFANNHLKSDLKGDLKQVRQLLKLIKSDVLLDFCKKFSQENILEIFDDISFIMKCLIPFDDAAQNKCLTGELIAETIEHIKPPVKRLKKIIPKLVGFYTHHTGKMNVIMGKMSLPFINSYLDKIIYCDTSQLPAMQEKVSEQAEQIDNLRIKIENKKQVLQPVVNSRRENINAMLQHGNEGKEGFPNEFYAGWDVKAPSYASVKDSLADVSSLATQLVLKRNNKTNKMTVTNHEYQKVSYGNQVFVTLIQHLQDNTNKNGPDAIIITEFMIVKNHQQIPQIELRSDKILLCHKNASQIFDKNDANSYERFLTQNEINELVKNELLLASFHEHPVLNGRWTLSNKTTDNVIGEMLESITPSFLKPEKHIDLSSLAITVESLLSSSQNITNPSHKKIRDDLLQLHAKLQFYIRAKDLIDEFLNQDSLTLTPGLERMKKCSESNPHHHIIFIADCQQIISAREQTWSSWKRSTNTTHLYNAISAIKFSDDDKANLACLDNLIIAIKKYQPAEEKVTQAGLYANTGPSIETVKAEGRQRNTKNNTNG